MDLILDVLDNKFLNVAHYWMKITFKSLLVKFFKRQDPLEGPSPLFLSSLVQNGCFFLWVFFLFFFSIFSFFK